MYLKKLTEHGSSLMMYDSVSENDNKVVSFISTLGKFGLTTVSCRIGAEKKNFSIPEALF